VMVGKEDVATVPAKSERMHGEIVGSKMVYIDAAGHSAPIENPEDVNAGLAAFFTQVDAAKN